MVRLECPWPFTQGRNWGESSQLTDKLIESLIQGLSC